jgi:hypothetical protein
MFLGTLRLTAANVTPGDGMHVILFVKEDGRRIGTECC